MRDEKRRSFGEVLRGQGFIGPFQFKAQYLKSRDGKESKAVHLVPDDRQQVCQALGNLDKLPIVFPVKAFCPNVRPEPHQGVYQCLVHLKEKICEAVPDEDSFSTLAGLGMWSTAHRSAPALTFEKGKGRTMAARLPETNELVLMFEDTNQLMWGKGELDIRPAATRTYWIAATKGTWPEREEARPNAAAMVPTDSAPRPFDPRYCLQLPVWGRMLSVWETMGAPTFAFLRGFKELSSVPSADDLAKMICQEIDSLKTRFEDWRKQIFALTLHPDILANNVPVEGLMDESKLTHLSEEQWQEAIAESTVAEMARRSILWGITLNNTFPMMIRWLDQYCNWACQIVVGSPAGQELPRRLKQLQRLPQLIGRTKTGFRAVRRFNQRPVVLVEFSDVDLLNCFVLSQAVAVRRPVTQMRARGKKTDSTQTPKIPSVGAMSLAERQQTIRDMSAKAKAKREKAAGGTKPAAPAAAKCPRETRASAPPRPKTRPAARAKAPLADRLDPTSRARLESKSSPLTAVKGVGPVLEAKLRAVGVNSAVSLAQASWSDVELSLDLAGGKAAFAKLVSAAQHYLDANEEAPK